MGSLAVHIAAKSDRMPLALMRLWRPEYPLALSNLLFEPDVVASTNSSVSITDLGSAGKKAAAADPPSSVSATSEQAIENVKGFRDDMLVQLSHFKWRRTIDVRI